MKTQAPGTWSISHICNLFEKGKLIPNPSFQRNKVWVKIQKSKLVERILKSQSEYTTIPAIYVHVRVDENGRIVYDVLDGHQRITTCIEFKSGDFTSAVRNNSFTYEGVSYNLKGLNYKKLPEELQHKFDNTHITVRFIEEATSWEIFDLFYDLNNGTALNNAEIRHAIPSETGKWIYDLGNHKVFSLLSTSSRRLQQFEYATKFAMLALDLSGVKLVGKQEDLLFDICKGEYDDIGLDKLRPKIKKLTEIMYYVFSSIKFRKVPKQGLISGFYCVLWRAFEICSVVTVGDAQRLWSDYLIRHEELLEENEKYCKDYVSTRKPWCKRIEFVDSCFPSVINSISLSKPDKDNKRFFTLTEKEVQLDKQDGDCADCGGEIKVDISHGDHVVPHAFGGQTDNNNIQVLCIPCHENKTVAQNRSTRA